MLMKKVKLFLACLLAVITAAYAQGQQVTGTITDTKGEPVAGVSVVVDGTTLMVSSPSAQDRDRPSPSTSSV